MNIYLAEETEALAVNPICDDVTVKKYAHAESDITGPGTIQENIHRRNADALGRTPQEREKFYKAMCGGVLLAGRIKANAGIPGQGTMVNCFVQAIYDTILGTPDKPGIYDTLGNVAQTMGMGGGNGCNFSNIRPKGAPVRDTSGLASGPVSVVALYNDSGSFVQSAGQRRGAQMAVLDVTHPDILDFIRAKTTDNRLSQFNISVGLTDEFMDAVKADDLWQLTHEVRPSDPRHGKSEDGLWIYDVLPAREIWTAIMKSTYTCADPGTLFLSIVNYWNPLTGTEHIRATNPCGEVPLPPNGSCILGSINLTKYVINPFTRHANFNWNLFVEHCKDLVVMLNNVIDVSDYPLEAQRVEALAKRRIGGGVTGLGSALAMLTLKYSSVEGRSFANKVTEVQRDAAFSQSVDLAKEEGAFPLFDRDTYCNTPYFKRLPLSLRKAIRKHGVRNSHVGSMAPTGTISIAFGENCSGGIEPMFAFKYTREVRTGEGEERQKQDVVDYAMVKYEEIYGPTEVCDLPDYFEKATSIHPLDHIEMVAAIQPNVCQGISKTVNVPEDFPFAEFEDLYMVAHAKGLKGITTFKPNPITGSILAETKSEDFASEISDELIYQVKDIAPVDGWDFDETVATPASVSSKTFYVAHPSLGEFNLHVSSVGDLPIAVHASGDTMPRNLGAICKTLSADIALDPNWAVVKLNAWVERSGSDAFSFEGPDDTTWHAASLVSAVAKIVLYRFSELGFNMERESKIEQSMFLRKEPKTKGMVSEAHYWDIKNVTTGDDISLFAKEVKMPDGTRRPISLWTSGEHNPTLVGLCMSLSLDMRVYDVRWVIRKLEALVSYRECYGDFMAFTPGDSEKQQSYGSTVAYVASVLLEHYHALGLMDDEERLPVIMGGGSACPSCDSPGTYIRESGCRRCTSCEYEGDCG